MKNKQEKKVMFRLSTLRSAIKLQESRLCSIDGRIVIGKAKTG